MSTAARLETEAYVSDGAVFEYDKNIAGSAKFQPCTRALAETKTASVAIGIDGDLWLARFSLWLADRVLQAHHGRQAFVPLVA